MIFNIKPLSKSSEDKVTDFAGKGMEKISLFIDDATPRVPSCFPYCDGADLRGLDMSSQQLVSTFVGADFSPKGTTKTNLNGAYLNGANLNGTDLTDADLTDAGLIDADLTDADLNGAYLNGAGLGGAILAGANLNGAYLGGAILGSAKLNNANLTNAFLSSANLTDATYDSATIWPSAEWWNNTTCPDGTNSDNNPSCGF